MAKLPNPHELIPRLVEVNPSAFFRRWKFVNRETGQVHDFGTLWPGQLEFLRAALEHPKVYALKAGKLGFTELECAWDAYRALFGHPFSRVHLLSKELPAARDLIGYVRFGLEHLPEKWGVRFLEEEAGGKTTTELHLWAPWMDPGDRRIIKSYAAKAGAAIDQSAAHTHADEFNHLDENKQAPTYLALNSTVEPETGTFHIVSRGAGPNYGADLFRAALSGENDFYPLFVPWSGRPRPEGWREKQALDMPGVGVAHFAPEEYEDALAGEETSPFIPLEVWDTLKSDLPPLLPGGDDQIVLALDAGVTGDCFAAVAATRRPDRPEFPAIRASKIWRPKDFPGGRIDFDTVEAWVRFLLEGGCPNGHPVSQKPESFCRPEGGDPCPVCRGPDQDGEVPPMNVVQLTFDPHQLESLYQALRRENIVWMSPFDQGSERLRADAGLYQYAVRRQLVHHGDPVLREHVENARAKVSPDEDTKLRIVKKSEAQKVDGIVAASMAVHRVMELNLS
jgi:hypothetical protein